MTKEERLQERCTSLEKIIKAIKPIYADSSSENQKAFIETIIGAAIWYLPHGKEYWNNQVSKNALESLKENKAQRLTRDHVYPRKESAKKLLRDSLDYKEDGQLLKELYQSELGVYVLVTPEENRRLIEIQRKHHYGNWEKAYDEAGIELIDYKEVLESEEEEFIQIFKRKR